MKVRHDEGIANHIGPEPCVAARKDVNEASVGEGIGHLETGQTRMIEVETVDAASTIKRSKRSIRCWPSSMSFSTTRAIITPSWCRNGSRDPSYCPHLNPIERLWGLMHRNVTHNKCYATCANSLMRRSVSCVKKFLGIGRISVIR